MKSEQGRPLFFNPEQFLDVVEQMINADEVERALWMLDNMPGYYRDNPPARALEIRDRLHKQFYTAVQYASEVPGTEVNAETVLRAWPLRAELLANTIKRLNESGVTPNVMEFADGTGWLKVGLHEKGLKFSHEGLSLGGEYLLADEFDFNIFVAFEVIEHLADPWDIYRNYLKFDRHADLVFLSTPLYTINGGENYWQNRPLGHLRTYTPGEFQNVAERMFRGFKFEIIADDTMVAIGNRAGA